MNDNICMYNYIHMHLRMFETSASQASSAVNSRTNSFKSDTDTTPAAAAGNTTPTTLHDNTANNISNTPTAHTPTTTRTHTYTPSQSIYYLLYSIKVYFISYIHL